MQKYIFTNKKLEMIVIDVIYRYSYEYQHLWYSEQGKTLLKMAQMNHFPLQKKKIKNVFQLPGG